MDTPLKRIRTHLGLSQAKLAPILGVPQTTLSLYERSDTETEIPPDTAGKLIAYARSRGLWIDFNHLYGGVELPVLVLPPVEAPPAQAAQAGG